MILYNKNKLIKAKIEKKNIWGAFQKSKTKFRIYPLQFRLVVLDSPYSLYDLLHYSAYNCCARVSDGRLKNFSLLYFRSAIGFN